MRARGPETRLLCQEEKRTLPSAPIALRRAFVAKSWGVWFDTDEDLFDSHGTPEPLGGLSAQVNAQGPYMSRIVRFL